MHTSLPGRSARLRRWLGRRWVAIVAVLVVVGVLGVKNFRFHNVREKPLDVHWGYHGWPQLCIDAIWYGFNESSNSIRILSWRALLIDAGIAVTLPLAAWLVFRRTQRGCERWNQISLATLLALAALAVVLCAIWNYEPAWPLTFS